MLARGMESETRVDRRRAQRGEEAVRTKGPGRPAKVARGTTAKKSGGQEEDPGAEGRDSGIEADVHRAGAARCEAYRIERLRAPVPRLAGPAARLLRPHALSGGRRSAPPTFGDRVDQLLRRLSLRDALLEGAELVQRESTLDAVDGACADSSRRRWCGTRSRSSARRRRDRDWPARPRTRRRPSRTIPSITQRRRQPIACS